MHKLSHGFHRFALDHLVEFFALSFFVFSLLFFWWKALEPSLFFSEFFLFFLSQLFSVSLKVGLFFGRVEGFSGLEGFGLGVLGKFQGGDFINKMEDNFHGGQVFGSVFVGTVKNDSEMASTV